SWGGAREVLGASRASVACPADDAVLAAILRRDGMIIGELASVSGKHSATRLDCLWSLHRQHAGHGGLIHELNVSACFLRVEPADDFFTICGVDHHRPTIRPAINQHVVANAAG